MYLNQGTSIVIMLLVPKSTISKFNYNFLTAKLDFTTLISFSLLIKHIFNCMFNNYVSIFFIVLHLTAPVT